MTNGTFKPKHFFEDFTMTTKRQDFEVCSGSEEEEYLEVEIHSPTDSSEDSLEVKVSPICLRNKRKCAEPRKVQDVLFQAPPKKRMCFKIKSETPTNAENPEPFRPWNADKNLSIPVTDKVQEPTNSINKCNVVADSKFLVPPPPQLSPQRNTKTDYNRPITVTPCRSRPSSPQPLPLIKKPNSREKKPKCDIAIKREIDCDPINLRVPLHPHLNVPPLEADKLMLNSAEAFPNLHSSISSSSSRKEQRNYKNMTRERRIEANARERTRVHTISAAFDTLRRSVPAYSHNQKLSKLSVLRIACSYIMTLSTLVDGPGTSDESAPSLTECVESVSKTIQKEGKLRKKKDEGD